MGTKAINKDYENYSSQNFLPIIWDKAKDRYVWDNKGKRYIDFTSGIFVANAGHSNPDICNAIRAQVNKQLIYSYSFQTEIKQKFLKKLIDITPDFCEKAFLLSAGTEATECAVKLMRLYTKRKVIISFLGSMHGKTALAENLTGDYTWATEDKNIVHLGFIKTKNFNHNITNNNIAGFMIESYQGWSARFFEKEYIQHLVKWAHKNNILVCFDEIQGGFGRTGELFAYQHYEVEPDLICVGKGISSSLPLSAVIGRKEIIDIADDLSSTHSGNPVCCAAGLANIEYIMKHKLINNAKAMGWVLQSWLKNFKEKYFNYIGEINCKGLLGAIIVNKKLADKICVQALKNGLLLVHTGRESVKIGPPLTITEKLLEEGLEILNKSIWESIK